MRDKMTWKPSGWMIRSALAQARDIEWTCASRANCDERWLVFTQEEAANWLAEQFEKRAVYLTMKPERRTRDGLCVWLFDVWSGWPGEEQLMLFAPTPEQLRQQRERAGLKRKTPKAKLSNADLGRGDGWI